MMTNELGAFPVPKIILDRIKRKHLVAFEQESSNSDSDLEVLPSTRKSRSVRRRRLLKGFSTFRGHLRCKKPLPTTKLPSENREGEAEISSPSLPEIEPPSPTMFSQVDMFAKSPPHKEEDKMKEKERTPKKNSAGATSPKVSDNVRRSSRIKKNMVSSISMLEAPTGLKAHPLLEAADEKVQTHNRTSPDLKPNASGDSVQHPSSSSFNDVVPENKNCLPNVKKKTGSPSKENKIQNESPKKETKETKAAPPDESIIVNATETHTISSSMQSSGVVESDPAAGHSNLTLKLSSREKKEFETNPQGLTPPQTRSSSIHNTGVDVAKDGTSTMSKEVGSDNPDYKPSQQKKQLHDRSSVSENNSTTQDVRKFSPKKIPLKGDIIKTAPVKSSPPANPVTVTSDQSGTESKSNVPNKPEKAEHSKSPSSANQLPINGTKIRAKKESANSPDSDSSKSSSEVGDRMQRNTENVSNKCGTAKKRVNEGSLSDSEKIDFDKFGPTATSTQIIILPNRMTSESESSSCEADIKQSEERQEKQDSILPNKSGAPITNKQYTDGNDAESESSDSEDGNSTSAGRFSSKLAKKNLKRKECSSRSESISSDSERETSSKTINSKQLSGTTTIPSHSKMANVEGDSSDTSTSQSEDENTVKAQQSNATITKSQQTLSPSKPRINTNSGSFTHESNSGKNAGVAKSIDPRTSTIVMKVKNKESDHDSNSSQSEDERSVKAQHSPAIADQAPMMKKVSRQSENSDTESSSSQSGNEDPAEVRHSPANAAQASLKGKVSSKSEDSRSESDSSQSHTVKAPHSPVIPAHAVAIKNTSGQLPRSQSSSSESDSDESNLRKNSKETGNTDFSQVTIAGKNNVSSSDSDASQSNEENPVKAQHRPAVGSHASPVKITPKQADVSDSESDSSRSEDDETVKTSKGNVPEKGMNSSSSGSDSDESNRRKNSKETINTDSRQVTIAGKNNENSCESEDSCPSNDENPVNAQQPPAMVSSASPTKKVSNQSSDGGSESDSSQARGKQMTKTGHSTRIAPQIGRAPKTSENINSESNSSESEDNTIPDKSHQAGDAVRRGVASEPDEEEKSSDDSDCENNTKDGGAPAQSPKQSSNSRIGKESSSESGSSDSEKEQKTTHVGVGSKKGVKRSNDESSNSDSNSSDPEQSQVHKNIRVKPMYKLITPSSTAYQTDNTNAGNVKLKPTVVHKGLLGSDSSSSSDDTPVQSEKQFTKQSELTKHLQKKVSASRSPQSDSLQNIKAVPGNHSSSSYSSDESETNQHEKSKNVESPRGVSDGKKIGKTAREVSLPDQPARTTQISVSRKRKADSVSSSDSSDTETKTKRRKDETPTTPVALSAKDTQSVFPGCDISVIPKPGSTPSSNVKPTKPTNQRSILEFAKPQAPVSSTPQQPQKHVRSKLDLLKSEYLNLGYQDVGDKIDFDSHPGLFEEDLLKNDVKVYVVQCPKEVDPESLIGRKIDLSEKETLIKLTGTCGSKTPYEVFCDLSDSDVGVSLITPSKRRKKFTLTSVPVAGRITIAETIHVPTVREVPSSSPPRVPFPKNLKPRNPFVDSDESAAEGILKKIKQKSKKQHPTSSSSRSESGLNAEGKKRKERDEGTVEALPNLLQSSKTRERAPLLESLAVTNEDTNHKKKKRKKDESAVGASAICEAESALKSEFNSNATKNHEHDPLAGGSDTIPEEKKKRKKRKKDKERSEADLTDIVTENPIHSSSHEEQLRTSGSGSIPDEELKKKKKKQKKDKERSEEPTDMAEHPSHSFSHEVHHPTSGSDLIPEEKTKKKKRKKGQERSEEPTEQSSHSFSHKERFPTTSVPVTGRTAITETPHVPTVLEVASSFPSRVQLSESLKPRSPFVDSGGPDPIADEEKKKKKKRKKDKERSVEKLTDITESPPSSSSHKEPLPTNSSDPIPDEPKKEKKKKRKKEKECSVEELTNVTTEHTSQDLSHKELLPTTNSDFNTSVKKKKKKKKHKEGHEESDLHIPIEISRDERELAPTSDLRNEDTSAPVAKKKKKKHRDL